MSLLEWLKTFTHMRENYKKFHGLLLLLVGLLVVPTTLFAQSEGEVVRTLLLTMPPSVIKKTLIMPRAT